MNEAITVASRSPTPVGRESLQAGLNRVYATLTGGSNGSPPGKPVTSGEPHRQAGGGDAVCLLPELFELTSFEWDVVLLCAGVQLDRRFQAACAEAHGDPKLECATFGMATSRLSHPHWEALSRLRPLRFWRLIELGPGGMVRAPLHLDERILHFLLDVPTADARLEGQIRPLVPGLGAADALQPAGTSLQLRGIARRWCSAVGKLDPILLTGDRPSTRLAAFIELCRASGCAPHVMNADDLPSSAAEREQLARLWMREGKLGRVALYIHSESGRADQVSPGGRFLGSWLPLLSGRIAIDAPGGSAVDAFGWERVEMHGLSADERKDVWRHHLGAAAQGMNGELDRIAEYFHFDESAIRLSATAALDVASSADLDLGQIAWHSCREYARRSLNDLARRIEPRAGWSELVLPPGQTEALQQIAIHVRQRAVVNEQWGFSARHARGIGLSALFAGPSGTGKTLTAEILAGELKLDLYQVDLATIVSKYIGETEKNLRQIFDAAEQSGAVLLFDEADALFGQRSEVKDSHDRYANLEISYLLQRMESYRGIAILTTNMQHALDGAFLRRIRFIVQFPFPDAASRARIWQGIFPKRTPLGVLDFEKLGQLNVSGGVIRNIAMHAAFLAAEQQTKVEMPHLLAAARIEYAKVNKPLTGAEVRGWE